MSKPVNYEVRYMDCMVAIEVKQFQLYSDATWEFNHLDNSIIDRNDGIAIDQIVLISLNKDQVLKTRELL